MSVFGTRTEVPQELIAVTLLSYTFRKPVLICSNLNLAHTEAQLSLLMTHITPKFDPLTNIIECRNETTLNHLNKLFLKTPPQSCIILRRYDTLGDEALTDLKTALSVNNSTIRKYLEHSSLILTSSKHIQQLDHGLRKHMLILQEHNYADADLILVEINNHAHVTNTGIESIRKAAESVAIVPELFAYMQDILVFIRAHRFVNCGINPEASTNFENVVRALCVLRGMKFATPMIIKEAALLTLPVQIKMLTFEEEPSLEYGGDTREARIIRNVLTETMIVDQVLKEIPVPK